ncbi:MAG: FadR/GntR family transcriptional regulator [Brevundimonas sp.]|nr:FadR/GntR family transcriptional regulator [Brevundimonas sp.]MDP3403331.1 FadR/GntR family transcriptional regulator [Brevundimonas sp.]
MPAPAPAPSLRHPRAGAERLHGAIARNLGVAIVSGLHQPGDILGNEIELSEQLAVSRSAYREAIRILSAKGLVESRPRTGTRVLPMDRWNLLDSDVLSWFFESEPSPVIVNGLFELRMIIEPAAAALAAVRRSDEELARMRTALEIMERKTLKTEAGQSADRDFHQAVLTATGNPPLVSLASTIGASVRWTTLYKQRKRRLPPDPMPEHWAVFEAIAASDPEGARSAMQALVAHALEQIAGPSGPKSARSVAVARALR